MSFIVSNTFNSHETLTGAGILELFQRVISYPLKVALNEQPKSNCSIVSVVSLLIDPVNETENVFAPCLRGCVCLLIVTQHSTMQSAACSTQRYHEI